MVLNQWMGLLGLLLGLCGCLHRPPEVKLATKTPIAVAFVADQRDASGTEVAPELVARVTAALVSRNLDPHVLPAEQVREAFKGLRASTRRLSRLGELAGDAPLVLLIEVKPVFFDFMSGRFKWTVYSRVSMAKRDALGEAQVDEAELPVFLQFDHERELSAQQVSASAAAERVGITADAFLGDRAEFPPATPQVGLAPAVVPSPALGPVYFVLVDRFANGDKANDAKIDLGDPAAFHGGDLQGVIDHLDALKSLGVETVWLSPVFQMRTEPFFGHGAFHGYWVEDLNAVEPRFGDRRLLRRLSDELHQRGMKLLLDVVLNHVAYEAPLVRAHPDWFHHRGNIADWNDRAQLEQADVMGLPDLDQDNEAVYAFLRDASLRWIDEVRPDGFRLDAVKHIPTAFWSRFSRDVHAHAGASFVLLGEYLEGDPVELSREQRAGGFDAMFDFPLHYALTDVFCRDDAPGKLAALLTLARDPRLVTLADNHDLPRLATACKGQLPRIKNALAFLLSAPGTPSLTYGTEAGLEGADEPANRADMRFDSGAPEAAWIREGLALRRAHRSLREGLPRVLALDDQSFVYGRFTPDEAALIAYNGSGSSREWPAVVGSASLVDADGMPAGSILPGRVAVAFARPSTVFSAEPARTREVKLVLASGGAKAVGAGDALGAWKPDRGVDSGRALTLPVGAVLQFKWVRRSDSKARAKPEWEPRGDRFVFVEPGDGPLVVESRWGE